jgi:hypothetical protein
LCGVAPFLAPAILANAESAVFGRFGTEGAGFWSKWCSTLLICRRKVARRTYTFRYLSAEHFVNTFRAYYGPVHKAFEALDAEGQSAAAQSFSSNPSLTPLPSRFEVSLLPLAMYRRPSSRSF